jgi:hypothetical protein
VYEYVDDKSKPIYEEVTRNVDDKSKPIYGDPPVIGYEQITITEIDPETSDGAGSSTYPQMRIFNAGVKLSF